MEFLEGRADFIPHVQSMPHAQFVNMDFCQVLCFYLDEFAVVTPGREGDMIQ